jgi:hypothetical protein
MVFLSSIPLAEVHSFAAGKPDGQEGLGGERVEALSLDLDYEAAAEGGAVVFTTFFRLKDFRLKAVRDGHGTRIGREKVCGSRYTVFFDLAGWGRRGFAGAVQGKRYKVQGFFTVARLGP